MHNQLLEQIRRAETDGAPDAVDQARAAYLEIAPTSGTTTDVRYRHGLSRLLRHQDVDGAMALFKEAAGDKSSSIAAEARISYALCLRGKQKRQQALFELRKLLPTSAQPSLHTVQALDFLAIILRESGAADAELDKVDTRRIEHILVLAEQSEEDIDRAHWWLRLAAAYQDAGTGGDLKEARTLLQKIIRLGNKAGPVRNAAREALKTLPR